MKNATTIIINGQEVSADLGTIRAILGLSDMATENVLKDAPKPKAPKAPKAKKQAKAPKAKAPKAEETKAEVQPEAKEPVYTKGGLLLQWNDDIAAKGKEKAVITKAYNSLVKQGFTVTRKRVGSWIEMYQSGDDKKPSKEFAAAKLDSGWTFIKGAWKYPYLLENYEDNFRK